MLIQQFSQLWRAWNVILLLVEDKMRWKKIKGTFLVAQSVKNLSAIQEMQVQSLCWADPLEENVETDSSILAWEIPWTEEPGGLQSMSCKELDTT